MICYRQTVSALASALVSAAAISNTAPMPVYEIEAADAVYLEVQIDQGIYRYARDSQLRDLVVVDAEGAELPSRIVSAQGQLSESSEQFPLRFFPVARGEDPARWLRRGGAELRIDENAIFLRLEPDAGTERQAQAVDFYIADISELQQAMHSLLVHWQPDSSSQYLEVEVSGTRDMQRWTPLSRDTLAQLSKDGETLLRNEVALALAPKQYNYLQLRFLQNAPVQLQALEGRRKTTTLEPPPPNRWRVAGELAGDQQPVIASAAIAGRGSIAAWEYQRDENAPVNGLSLALGDVPYGDNIQLYSRRDQRQVWRFQYSGVWFNAKVGDTWQQSEPIALRPSSDPYWRLELSKNYREVLQPILVFQFPRQRLQFIANNNPPYRLAVTEEIPTTRPSNQVLAQLLRDQDIAWQTVDIRELDAAQPPGREAAGIRWQPWILWGVLVLAVVVLLGFAIRLMKQMNQNGSRNPRD